MNRLGRLAIVVILGVFVGICVCFSAYDFLDSWLGGPNETEQYRTDTAYLLHEVEADIKGTPIIKSWDYTVCGNLLSSLVRRNKGQYSIDVVAVWGDGGTPIPAPIGGNEARVRVLFSDGTTVTLEYYEHHVDRCTITF